MHIGLKAAAAAVVMAATLLGGCALRISDQTWEERVRRAVERNPEIVLQALEQDPEALLRVAEQGVRTRRARQAEEDFRAALDAPLNPVVDDGRVVRGRADAPVTVVAYTHFLCGFCARGSGDMRQLVADHPNEVRYVVKHAPTSEAGELGARLFEALALQGADKAWTFYDKAFGEQESVLDAPDPGRKLQDIAEAVDGVDRGRLLAEADSEAVRDRVRGDLKEFQDFGFHGVPVYLMNGAPVEGAMPMSFLEKALALVRERAAK
ncbi:DsbA family protein [Desulfocurvus sp. DL9XJH121]